MSDELREFTDALRRIEDRLLNSFLVRVSRIYFRWSIWLLGLAAIISAAPFFGYTTEEFVASLPYTSFLVIYFLLAIYLIHFRGEPSIYADSISRLLGRTVDKKQVRLLNRLYIVAWTLPAIIMFPVTYMLMDRWYAWVVALPLFLGTSNLLSFIIDNYVLGIDTRWETIVSAMFYLVAIITYTLSRILGCITDAIYASIILSSLIYTVLGYLALGKALR